MNQQVVIKISQQKKTSIIEGSEVKKNTQSYIVPLDDITLPEEITTCLKKKQKTIKGVQLTFKSEKNISVKDLTVYLGFVIDGKSSFMVFLILNSDNSYYIMRPITIPGGFISAKKVELPTPSEFFNSDIVDSYVVITNYKIYEKNNSNSNSNNNNNSNNSNKNNNNDEDDPSIFVFNSLPKNPVKDENGKYVSFCPHCGKSQVCPDTIAYFKHTGKLRKTPYYIGLPHVDNKYSYTISSYKSYIEDIPQEELKYILNSKHEKAISILHFLQSRKGYDDGYGRYPWSKYSFCYVCFTKIKLISTST